MTEINRRNFLAAASAGIASTNISSGADADKKIKIGLIGCGWYGMVDVKAALEIGGVEVIALCDVDSEHLNKSADEVEKRQGSRPKTFKHYEELLAVPGLQALFIGTPPQWHALPFIAACQRKLDIYCEKPLAYDVREGRAMVEAAKKAGNIVQIGFQRRQSAAIQQAGQYINAGKAGKVVQVNANIHYTASPKDNRPQDPPPSLDWDLWCGPAPKLPYSPNVSHLVWRLEETTGHGHLVDWGIHLIDAIRMALNLSTPGSIQASGGLYYLKDKITTPDVLTVHFDFDRCPVFWTHRLWGAVEYAPEVANGIFFFCEKETIFATDNKWMIISKDKKKEKIVHEVKTPKPIGVLHVADFLQAVRSRKQPAVTPEDGYRSTTTVQLAMIAYDVGRKIRWDEKREAIVDDPDANKRLKRDYRPPYKHPYPG